MEKTSSLITKGKELRLFLFLTAVLAPALAVLFVAGFGFVVWFYQLFTGSLPTH
jgi:nitrate reductase NapE